MSNRYILDLASCPLNGAAEWLPDVRPAKNLKDPAKIEADIADKRAEQQEKLGLDIDLCRISAIGLIDVSGWEHGCPDVRIAQTEDDERDLLAELRPILRHAETVTFNGLGFDLPLLERRMLYNGLPPLGWNLDRYRSPHIDLMARLSNHGQRPFRSLSFYAKRLGWTDLVKPLSGAEEAQAVQCGNWEGLMKSVDHDIEATRRLAVWMGVVKPSQVAVSA